MADIKSGGTYRGLPQLIWLALRQRFERLAIPAEEEAWRQVDLSEMPGGIFVRPDRVVEQGARTFCVFNGARQNIPQRSTAELSLAVYNPQPRRVTLSDWCVIAREVLCDSSAGRTELEVTYSIARRLGLKSPFAESQFPKQLFTMPYQVLDDFLRSPKSPIAKDYLRPIVEVMAACYRRWPHNYIIQTQGVDSRWQSPLLSTLAMGLFLMVEHHSGVEAQLKLSQMALQTLERITRKNLIASNPVDDPLIVRKWEERFLGACWQHVSAAKVRSS